MAQTKSVHEDLLRRPLYLYDLPRQVLESLQPHSEDSSQLNTVSNKDTARATPETQEDTDTSTTASVGSQSCSLCGLKFPTVVEQRSHQRSDLHTYNLKQKLRGHAPVSEADFEGLIADLNESLSGSDTDESEDETDRKDTTLSALLKKQASLAGQSGQPASGHDIEDDDTSGSSRISRGSGKPPLIWLSSPLLPENHYFGIYRAIFGATEISNEEALLPAIKTRQLQPISIPRPAKDGTLPQIAYKGPHIFLCMIGGGHFAAMVVSLAPRLSKHASSSGPMNREATVLAHKTFHRYTTRRKQGGSQSANDNAKGAAHSAGAGIRRYNEQALVEDVRALLRDWKGLLDTSDLLFIRATGTTNRRTLFGPYEDQILQGNDPRIRGFPFSTRRATQNELMRAFIELTRLKVKEVVPIDPGAAAAEAAAKTNATSAKAPKPTAPKLSEAEEAALLHTTQLQALARRSKVPAILTYLTTNKLTPSFVFQPAEANHHAPTLLHLAAAQNSAPLVSALLIRGNGNPCITNGDGKTPFELAGERATRDAFRVARHELGEEAWNWDSGARIPPPMTKQEAEQRDEREKVEAAQKEAARRKVEEQKLKAEPPRVFQGTSRKGGVLGLGAGVEKSAEERRLEEARGLTPEQKMRLERERRARAAEERLKRMRSGGGV